MKQTIENIREQLEQVIKKNLPEKKKHSMFKEMANVNAYHEINCFNQALSQINTSLIADEVLKVVVETTIKIIDERLQNIVKISSYDITSRMTDLVEIKQLLSEHLSPNKENEKIYE